jgi:hypothetical protein
VKHQVLLYLQPLGGIDIAPLLVSLLGGRMKFQYPTPGELHPFLVTVTEPPANFQGSIVHVVLFASPGLGVADIAINYGKIGANKTVALLEFYARFVLGKMVFDARVGVEE